ncbi:hypothetical protein D3C79_498960 [compost metagenome]
MEIFIIEQRIKQRIDAADGSEWVFGQLFHQPRNIARVGNQQITSAQLEKQQAIHRQRKDMVERQCSDYQFLTIAEQRPVGGVALRQIGLHIAVRQHRAFRHASGTAGILQERQIGIDDARFDILQAAPTLQSATERNRGRQVVFRHQSLNVFHHEVNQRAFGGGELIAHTRQDHMFYLGIEHHFFQRMGKVGDDYDGAGAAVIQLVFQLARRIQRVNVYHHHAGAQNTE